MTPSPVHMDEKYWCQPQKSLWFRKNEPFSNYTPDVTCPNCLKVVDGSVGDDVVHMVQDQILSTGVVPLCGLNKTRIHTRRSSQVTCRRCIDLHTAEVTSNLYAVAILLGGLFLLATLSQVD